MAYVKDSGNMHKLQTSIQTKFMIPHSWIVKTVISLNI